MWFGLVVAPAKRASLLGSQFDSKQCREQFVTPLSCFPQSRCNSLAFRTSFVLRLLLDLDTCGGIDKFDTLIRFGCFPLFLKKVANIIAPKLSIIFRKLIRLGSFQKCWWSTNVILFPRVLHPIIGKLPSHINNPHSVQGVLEVSFSQTLQGL